MRREIAIPAALLACCGTCEGANAQKSAQGARGSAVGAPTARPNVVIFYLDDMGFGDLGVTGATGYATPNIDRLSMDGVRLTKFYSPAPVSSASRAGLMTGCYPKRVGIEGALSPKSNTALDPSETTIASLLKAKGYHTAIVGKWHLGNVEVYPPSMYGFDEYFGLPYSNDMWPYGHVPTPGEDGKYNIEKAKNPPLPLYDGRKVARYIETMRDQDQLTTLYTERAVRIISENRGGPFFLYIAHSMPHVPLGVSDKFRGKSGVGLYGDVMMELDWSVGQVVEALRRSGLEDNTLVIFTSDNGPWWNYGDSAGSTAAMRGAKFTLFEGGQLVGCIMKWPARIPKGFISNKPTSAIDILPTLAAITGSPLPKHKIDGVSLLPLLTGDANYTPHEFLFYSGCRAVRDGRFKLILPGNYGSYTLLPGTGGSGGKISKDSVPLSLFDLRRDPGERVSVLSLFPDETERLQQALADMDKDLGVAGHNGPGKRHSAKVDQNKKDDGDKTDE